MFVKEIPKLNLQKNSSKMVNWKRQMNSYQRIKMGITSNLIGLSEKLCTYNKESNPKVLNFDKQQQ